MGAKSKNLLSVNKLLTNKNIDLQREVDELLIFKEMALKELAKLKSEIAEFESCNRHIIQGFVITPKTHETCGDVLLIQHTQKLAFLCQTEYSIYIFPYE